MYQLYSAQSFLRLYARVKKWLRSSSRTLRHNTQSLWTCFEEWGKTKVESSVESWERKAAGLELKGAVKKGCLWIDSFDVCLKGKSTTIFCTHCSLARTS
jgi:hypothetical protein